MADIARDVASLLRALETGPVHVVGISLGGMVAFQLMADHPELVRSAVIINSGPAFPGRTWKGFVALWSRVLILRWKGLPALGETIARRLFPRPEQADARRAFAEQFVRNDQSSYERTLRAIGRFDVSARLGDVRCPVLALASDHDYTPLADHEAWVRRSPGARLEVIRDAGHASTVDQPEAVNRAVLAFLEAVESSPRP
jgi:pimeloyl-ACP methyl ester carboxylesterase